MNASDSQEQPCGWVSSVLYLSKCKRALLLYQINTYELTLPVHNVISFALEMRFMSHNFWMGEWGFLRVFINKRLYVMTYHLFNNCQADWLTDIICDCLTDLFSDQLIDWFLDFLGVWLIVWWYEWMTDWLSSIVSPIVHWYCEVFSCGVEAYRNITKLCLGCQYWYPLNDN